MNKRITLPFFSLWLTGKAYKDNGLSIKGGLMPIIKDGELDYVFESGWATYIMSLVGNDDRPLNYIFGRFEFATIPTDKPFYIIFMAEDQILGYRRLIVKNQPAPGQVALPIPPGCTDIYLPSSVDILCEFYYDPVIDATNQIADLETLEHIFRRDKTSGVISDTSFPMEFVKKAGEFIKSKFDQDGLYAEMQCLFYQRGKKDNNYTLVKKSTLNFEGYKEYQDKIIVESADEDLTMLINSEGKTKYDILVDDVKDSKFWQYKRMNLVMQGEYTMPVNQGDITPNSQKFMPRINLDTAEVIPGAGDPDFRSQEYSVDLSSGYFFKAGNSNAKINVQAKFSVYGEAGDRSNPIEFVRIYIAARAHNGNIRPLHSVPHNIQYDNSQPIPIFWGDIPIDYDQDKFGHEVFGGEEVFLSIECNNEVSVFKSPTFDYFNVSMRATSLSSINIDVVDPLRLIQKYLDEMSGVPGSFRASIEWEERNYRTMIVAAESIRGIPGAKLHGSPNDFFDWMKVLGYEYECIDRKLVFKSRDKFFDRNVTAMSLRAEELADLIVQADNTYAYTTVEIGYDKKDYDSVNGRCEANGKYCYTTGLVATSDNKLSLISPYRADSMGIEYLCQERAKDSTDTKSDNDVFFVALKDNGNLYTEYKDVKMTDSVYGVEMFNAPFNPYFLIKRNESLIGINAKEVKFKSTDMSRTAEIIEGNTVIDPYVNQAISKGLFNPIEYNFAAGFDQDLPAPALRNGLVKFVWKKEILQGFIKEVRKNPHAPTETTWLLWAVR